MRIRCESEFRWSATNGSFRGLLQIGPWWKHAYPRTPRRVVLRRHFDRLRPVKRIRVYNTGARERDIVRKRRQHVRLTGLGAATCANPYHGWAAIRVGQRAVSRDGPNTYWELACRSTRRSLRDKPRFGVVLARHRDLEPTKPKVTGSNPGGRATSDLPQGAHA